MRCSRRARWAAASVRPLTLGRALYSCRHRGAVPAGLSFGPLRSTLLEEPCIVGLTGAAATPGLSTRAWYWRDSDGLVPQENSGESPTPEDAQARRGPCAGDWGDWTSHQNRTELSRGLRGLDYLHNGYGAGGDWGDWLQFRRLPRGINPVTFKPPTFEMDPGGLHCGYCLRA